MSTTLRFAALITFVCLGTASAQTATAVQSPTRRHVETLAAPGLEGRMAGTPGEAQAADYLVQELQRLGAKPLPGQAGLPPRLQLHRGFERRRLHRHGRA